MNIYTSYYSSPVLRKISPEELIPVSISLYPPKGWTGHHYLPLCPEKDIFREVKSTGNHQTYVRQLLDQLDHLDPAHVLNDLRNMSRGKPVVLLCFEKFENQCHRNVVKQWFNNNGIHVEELSNNNYIQFDDSIPLF